MNIAHDHILARVHMYAVFPCLAALVRLDDGARSLISGRRFGVQIKTRSGLSSRLDFLDGDVRVDSERAGYRAIELLFLTDRQLNKSFSGSGFSLPIPVRGFTRLARMRAFSRLTMRLQHVLMASPPQLMDEELLAVHADLLIGELIPSAIAQLARFDEPCRRWLAPYCNAVARFEVDGGASSAVRLQENGAVHAAEVSGEIPDVVISFRDRRVAMTAIHGDLDHLAALGKGEMTIRGMIPLADALGSVLDRLGRLMNVGR